MDVLESQVEGLMGEVDEDRMVAEMLGELEAKPSTVKADIKPAPAVEVIQPRPTKLLVSIPPDDPNGMTVTRVEVTEDGNFRILEAERAPTSEERALIVTGKREVIRPVGAAEPEKKSEGRPWWHYAIALAGAGGAWWAYNKYNAPPQSLEEVEEELDVVEEED